MRKYLFTYKTTAALAAFTCLFLLFNCTRTEKSETADIDMQSYLAAYTPAVTELLPGDTEISQKEQPPASADQSLEIPGRQLESAMFFPETQKSIGMEGVILTVPAGAMNKAGDLSLAGLLEEDLPPVPAELINVTACRFAAYRFLPHGMLFDSPVTIAMAFDKSLIPVGYTPDDIYTFFYDENDLRWKALERDSINHHSKLIVSTSSHFTDMINAVIMVPEAPATEGFVPTRIKDIKAADPTAGITVIDPPLAGNEGDAALSYPLSLPAGRSGMQPRLSLDYSSDAGSGWTGLGWGLTVPGISVDIKWGVPRYLADKESETYHYAGSQLTPVAHRGEYADRTAEKRFYSRIERDYSKIIRHGNNPTEYWWEVTAKNGTKSFYGGLPETGVLPGAVSMDANGNIGFWALVKTGDTHDNFVLYSYDKPQGCGQQLYISEISYTGHEAEEGPYKVQFLRDDDTNDYERNDQGVNAR
ncbi:MAG: hypothetical protein KFF49_12975, partial [Bacteroidales bacterium]|nr:hypothetical protein [Bacteroidales bacterium]